MLVLKDVLYEEVQPDKYLTDTDKYYLNHDIVR